MKHRFDSAGLEPSLEELVADPVVRLVMRRDGLSEADIWGAIRCGRVRLGYEQRAALAGERLCCREHAGNGAGTWLKCA